MVYFLASFSLNMYYFIKKNNNRSFLQYESSPFASDLTVSVVDRYHMRPTWVYFRIFPGITSDTALFTKHLSSHTTFMFFYCRFYFHSHFQQPFMSSQGYSRVGDENAAASQGQASPPYAAGYQAESYQRDSAAASPRVNALQTSPYSGPPQHNSDHNQPISSPGHGHAPPSNLAYGYPQNNAQALYSGTGQGYNVPPGHTPPPLAPNGNANLYRDQGYPSPGPSQYPPGYAQQQQIPRPPMATVRCCHPCFRHKLYIITYYTSWFYIFLFVIIFRLYISSRFCFSPQPYGFPVNDWSRAQNAGLQAKLIMENELFTNLCEEPAVCCIACCFPAILVRIFFRFVDRITAP